MCQPLTKSLMTMSGVQLKIDFVGYIKKLGILFLSLLDAMH